jgi:polyisoprenoid-binding protein YceI
MKKIILITLLSAFPILAATAADYKIDADHSTVGFKIKHLAISTVPGRFTEFSGTFSFDPANIAASKANATIAAKSINTEQKKRDDHLRSPDFFDASQFPEITFKSSTVTEIDKENFKVIGALTIHGVTQSVTLDVTYTGSAKDPWGNDRAAFTATTKLNRKDFGLTWNKLLESGGLLVGEEVSVTIEIEGIKIPSK